jgi:hypothetical protein
LGVRPGSGLLQRKLRTMTVRGTIAATSHPDQQQQESSWAY